MARVKGSKGPLPSERRRLIAERLMQRGSVSVAALEEEFGISPMTARRDLDDLERQGIARRTHGGAVLPRASAHEDSFVQRLEVAGEDKDRLAEAAVGELSPGQAIFLDSSTTAYSVARRLVRENLRCTIVTNAEPVMHLVSESEASQIELIGVGGRLRKLTRSYVGPQALAGIEAHYGDVAIVSVRTVTRDGDLTDPEPLEAEIKAAMLRRAGRRMLLVDGTKFGRPALAVIGSATDLDLILATDVPEDALRVPIRAGVEVRTL